jgi:hypothetical protein
MKLKYYGVVVLVSLFSFYCYAQKKKMRNVTFISAFDEQAEITIIPVKGNIQTFHNHITLDLEYVKHHVRKNKEPEGYIKELIITSPGTFGNAILYASKQPEHMIEFINRAIESQDPVVLIIKRNEKGFEVEIQQGPQAESNRDS